MKTAIKSASKSTSKLGARLFQLKAYREGRIGESKGSWYSSGDFKGKGERKDFFAYHKIEDALKAEAQSMSKGSEVVFFDRDGKTLLRGKILSFWKNRVWADPSDPADKKKWDMVWIAVGNMKYRVWPTEIESVK